MKLKISVLTVCFVLSVAFTSCVDGEYNPEERWVLNSQEIDGCEENDSFDAAFEVSSDLELLYLNFYDDIVDYYLIYFSSGDTYKILADVPFDHLTDTIVAVYDANHETLAQSSAPDDDDRDSVITGFSVSQSGYYYVVVLNTFSSGKGELRGYSLFIEEE